MINKYDKKLFWQVLYKLNFYQIKKTNVKKLHSEIQAIKVHGDAQTCDLSNNVFVLYNSHINGVKIMMSLRNIYSFRYTLHEWKFLTSLL